MTGVSIGKIQIQKPRKNCTVWDYYLENVPVNSLPPGQESKEKGKPGKFEDNKANCDGNKLTDLLKN